MNLKIDMWAFAFAIAAVVTNSSCAAVFTGTTSTVSITSDPSGAKIYVDGEYKGEAPLDVTLGRTKDHAITAKKPGYSETRASVRRVFNAVSVANILCLPLLWVCFGVDAISGGIWKFESTNVAVKLDNSPTAPPAP